MRLKLNGTGRIIIKYKWVLNLRSRHSLCQIANCDPAFCSLLNFSPSFSVRHFQSVIFIRPKSTTLLGLCVFCAAVVFAFTIQWQYSNNNKKTRHAVWELILQIANLLIKFWTKSNISAVSWTSRKSTILYNANQIATCSTQSCVYSWHEMFATNCRPGAACGHRRRHVRLTSRSISASGLEITFALSGLNS